MPLTSSTPLQKSMIAPDFSLPDVVLKKPVSLSDIQSDVATVVIFMCNHCPFVVYIKDKLVEVAQRYQAQGVAFVAISANDVKDYPEDSPEKMAQFAKDNAFTFPYLYDESQSVARAYQAACTPDLYVFDQYLCCVYHGQFDDARPGNNIPVTGDDLSQALDALLTGKPVSTDQKPSVGCNIKWK